MVDESSVLSLFTPEQIQEKEQIYKKQMEEIIERDQISSDDLEELIQSLKEVVKDYRNENDMISTEEHEQDGSSQNSAEIEIQREQNEEKEGKITSNEDKDWEQNENFRTDNNDYSQNKYEDG